MALQDLLVYVDIADYSKSRLWLPTDVPLKNCEAVHKTGIFPHLFHLRAQRQQSNRNLKSPAHRVQQQQPYVPLL